MPHHHVQGMKEWWNTWRNVIWPCFFLSTKNTSKQQTRHKLERCKLKIKHKKIALLKGRKKWRKHPYCVEEFDVFWKIKQPSYSNHLGEEREEKCCNIFKAALRQMLNISPTYPKSLRTIWGVNKVTSPRKSGGPSRHHELGIRYTTAVVNHTCSFMKK